MWATRAHEKVVLKKTIGPNPKLQAIGSRAIGSWAIGPRASISVYPCFPESVIEDELDLW